MEICLLVWAQGVGLWGWHVALELAVVSSGQAEAEHVPFDVIPGLRPAPVRVLHGL